MEEEVWWKRKCGGRGSVVTVHIYFSLIEVAHSYHRVRGLYFLAVWVIFAATITRSNTNSIMIMNPKPKPNLNLTLT